MSSRRFCAILSPFRVRGLLVAFAASALSGIVAGIYPSFKATQIHPADIIREI